MQPITKVAESPTTGLKNPKHTHVHAYMCVCVPTIPVSLGRPLLQ